MRSRLRPRPRLRRRPCKRLCCRRGSPARIPAQHKAQLPHPRPHQHPRLAPAPAQRHCAAAAAPPRPAPAAARIRRKSQSAILIFCMRARRSGGGDVPLGRGGLAGRKCARRAARGAPGVLCARSTSRMVVGKAPVAARGALRALKPRATPRRRGEGSVARACCCRVSWQVRGQIVVGHVKFCQCPASATKFYPSIARHGMGRPPYQWQWQCAAGHWHAV